jgi:hypothetical protein
MVAQELSNQIRMTQKQEHSTKSKTRKVLKENIGKQCIAWPAYEKYRHTQYKRRRHVERRSESEMAEPRDLALQTKYQATKISQTETDRKCGICHQFDDKTDHVLSACPILAK